MHAAVMLVGGLLAAVYLFRPLAVAFSGATTPAVALKAPLRTAAPLGLALVAITMGFAGNVLANLAADAAPFASPPGSVAAE